MKHKNRKFFGHTGYDNNSKRRKYGYPLDIRTKREIKEADDIKLLEYETLCK